MNLKFNYTMKNLIPEIPLFKKKKKSEAIVN